MNRGRVVEERRGKKMDGCPLTASLAMQQRNFWEMRIKNKFVSLIFMLLNIL
jgi:hypothetical protein